jgi:zinc protease
VFDAELTPRKAALVGNFSRSLETNAGIAAQIGSLVLHGIPPEEINNYLSKVQGVTAAMILRYAGRHLNPKSASIIAAGNAQRFAADLKKYNAVEIIPIADLDLKNK